MAEIAFTATRSGDFEVRFAASSCDRGRIIAAGRHEPRANEPMSMGHVEWVEPPADVVPLSRGDMIRVCLRDGLAAATGAAEVVDPPSFWPQD